MVALQVHSPPQGLGQLVCSEAMSPKGTQATQPGGVGAGPHHSKGGGSSRGWAWGRAKPTTHSSSAPPASRHSALPTTHPAPSGWCWAGGEGGARKPHLHRSTHICTRTHALNSASLTCFPSPYTSFLRKDQEGSPQPGTSGPSAAKGLPRPQASHSSQSLTATAQGPRWRNPVLGRHAWSASKGQRWALGPGPPCGPCQGLQGR